MSSEKVTVEQAVQKLSEARNNNNARLNSLESRITEIHDMLADRTKDTTALPENIISLQEKMTNQIEAIQSQTHEWKNATMSKLEQRQQELEEVTSNFRDMKMELRKIYEAIAAKPPESYNLHQSTEDGSDSSKTKRSSPTLDEAFINDHFDRYQQPTTIIIPPVSSIPTFAATITENPRQFLIRVKEYTESMNHWNDQLLLKGISQFLRDTALEWYCQLGIAHRRPQTWTEFQIIFLNQFNSPIRRARQKQQWKNCKQEEGETINEFIVRLRALWQEQKPNETENDLIRHLMCKMRNDLLTMIGISRCESLDEIIIEAQKVEEILYQRSKQTKRNDHYPIENAATASAYNEEIYPEIQAMSAYQTNQPARSYNRKNTSSNIIRNGLTARRQPYRPTYTTTNQWGAYSYNQATCYACGRKGHFRKYCPYENNTDQQQNVWYQQKNEYGAQGGRV